MLAELANFNPNKRSPANFSILHCTKLAIDGLQSILRESNNKDMAAVLDKLTIEANEESFVIVLQHGSNDVT